MANAAPGHPPTTRRSGRSPAAKLGPFVGGGPGKGGDVILTLNGTPVGKGRVEQTQGRMIAVDESASAGLQRVTPITEEYTVEDSVFQDKLYSVKVEIDT